MWVSMAPDTCRPIVSVWAIAILFLAFLLCLSVDILLGNGHALRIRGMGFQRSGDLFLVGFLFLVLPLTHQLRRHYHSRRLS